MKFSAIFSISILCFHFSFAQVGNIKDDVEVDINKQKPTKQHSSSTATTYNYSNDTDATNQYNGSGIGALVELVGYLFVGIYKAQETTLNNKAKNPELVSLESINKVGNYGKQDGFLFAPHIRGNWGIFSTDFRLQTIHDLTGTLQTQDWQIIQFNLPLDFLKISYGIGLSRIAEYDFSYFEQTVRGEIRFAKRKGTASVEYRIAKKGDGDAFRKETNAFIDYELLSRGKFHLSPSIMLSKHNYFNVHKQLYIGGGVNMRVF